MNAAKLGRSQKYQVYLIVFGNKIDILSMKRVIFATVHPEHSEESL